MVVAWAQENLADVGTECVPVKTLYFKVRIVPANVPLTLDALPNDGNEPEYLVGISAAASASVDTARPLPLMQLV